mgnify:CR=1 FL=1
MNASSSDSPGSAGGSDAQWQRLRELAEAETGMVFPGMFVDEEDRGGNVKNWRNKIGAQLLAEEAEQFHSSPSSRDPRGT